MLKETEKVIKIIEKNKELKPIKNEKGITLIALIVTIIVLLILAGITMATLTGEDGLINNANNAKEETEIANEKEIVDRATINAMGNNKRGNIIKEELQDELDRITKVGDTEVEDSGEKFNVVFTQTQRYYTVNKDGDIIEEGKIIVDKYPGDITVGENGEELDGSEEHPYEIWCIEDLCAFSNMVDNDTYNFRNKIVMLMTDLDFNSKYSYVNGIITIDGNIKSCNSIEELRENLTTNEGFYPIGDGKKTTSNFKGIFDGNNNSISSIYINRKDMNVGLFGNILVGADSSVCIKNIIINGEITGNIAGGIVGNALVSNKKNNILKLENCHNNANINGISSTGGIIGNRSSSEEKLIISNCSNNGNISGENQIGGIIGNAYINVTVINCNNTGKITGEKTVGGIVGYSHNTDNVVICNTYNNGNIESKNLGGGIIGQINWGGLHLENCINIGTIKGSTIGGIGGRINTTQELLITKNCYYLNTNIKNGFGNSNMEENEEISGLTDLEIKSNEILETLNNYVRETKEKEGIELKKWINNKNGYPIFE